MRTSRPPALSVLAASAVATASALIQAAPVHADVTSVGGGAYGERVSVTTPLAAVSSGPTPSVTLPSSGGGPYTSTVASARAGTVLSTGIITVSTRGDRVVSHLRTVTSSARVNGLIVNAGAVRASEVTSSCTANGTGSRGTTTLLGSNLGVSSSPAPNTVRRVAGLGTVTINEQIRTNEPEQTTRITVNALHIRLSGGTAGSGDIVIGQSRCEANGPDVLLSADASAGAAGVAGSGGSGSPAGVAGSGTPGGSTGSGGNVGAAQTATAVPGTARFTG